MTMFKSILVPLDGSAESNSALPAARTFARATGAAITLIRVCDEVNDAQTNLTRVADELAASGVQVRVVVRHGDPGEEILTQARAQNADLIVMRTHGRSGIGRMLLGSVTQHVLRESHVPVMLLRPGGRRMNHLGKVLVPVDGSPGGAVALGTAVQLAQTTGAALHLLEVVTPVVSYVTSGVWSDGAYLDPTWDEEALAAAKSYVDGIGARVAEGVPLVNGEAVIGTPIADTIVDRATALGCDLVLMSSHGLTGVGRALLGSIADAVVRKADCPVLIILASDRAADEGANSEMELATAAPATI